jgi:hypothetical protein
MAVASGPLGSSSPTGDCIFTREKSLLSSASFFHCVYRQALFIPPTVSCNGNTSSGSSLYMQSLRNLATPVRMLVPNPNPLGSPSIFHHLDGLDSLWVLQIRKANAHCSGETRLHQIQVTCSIAFELRRRKINPTSLTPCSRTARSENLNFSSAMPSRVEASEWSTAPPPSEVDSPHLNVYAPLPASILLTRPL